MLARSGLAVHPSVHQGGAVCSKGEPILAAKIGPGDHFFAKIGPGDYFLGGSRFWCDRPMGRRPPNITFAHTSVS